MIEQIFATGGGREGTKPAWSSENLPRLCEVLGVPLWLVTGLYTAEEQTLLCAANRVHAVAPERFAKFVTDTDEKSRDIARSHGWVEHTPMPELEPPKPERAPKPGPEKPARGRH